MARYKEASQDRIIVAISLEDQLIPGSFEFTLREVVDNRLDLSPFDQFYSNDKAGPKAYPPRALLKVVLYAYSKGLLSSRKIEAACRSNVLFMALALVMPQEHRPESPLVGRIGSEVRAVHAARTSPFAGATAAPPVPRSTVDISRPDWAPVICFVADGECAQSLLFALGSQELEAFVPRVWVAGEPEAAVTLAWQHWRSSGGWQDVADTTGTTATVLALDPDAAGNAETVEVALPEELVSEGGQAVLYAERNWVRGSDGVTVTVRSNPLLVTVHGGA